MRVSGDFIKTDGIQEYPIEDRFLKLPIENFLALKGVEPIAPQWALINAINNPNIRQVCGCLSRRTGKTFIANHVAFLKAMEPNTKVLIVSPNYSLSNISWNEQEAILAEYGIEIKSKNKTDKEIHLENGSMIKFGSIAQANSLVGRSYSLILFDECALDPKGRDAFNIQLRPTLDTENSKVIFISTPRGLNWFYDFYMNGFDENNPSWFSIHSTWRDNPRAVESDIMEAKRNMSSAEFKQEYEADFATFEGQIYEDFSTEEHVREYPHDMEDYFETIMGVDPGYKDPTGALVIRYHPEHPDDPSKDVFWVTWDYCLNAKSTKAHAEKFVEVIDKFDVEMLFVDSAAAQFRADLAAEYDISSSKSKKSVNDGIAHVQALVSSGRLLIDPSCEDLILVMNNYRWDPNDALMKPKPLHDKFSHLADALRYALYSYVR
jgi:hypothetical protein